MRVVYCSPANYGMEGSLSKFCGIGDGRKSGFKQFRTDLGEAGSGGEFAVLHEAVIRAAGEDVDEAASPELDAGSELGIGSAILEFLRIGSKVEEVFVAGVI